MLKLMGKKIFTIYAENICLSKPVLFACASNEDSDETGQMCQLV